MQGSWVCHHQHMQSSRHGNKWTPDPMLYSQDACNLCVSVSLPTIWRMLASPGANRVEDNTSMGRDYRHSHQTITTGRSHTIYQHTLYAQWLKNTFPCRFKHTTSIDNTKSLFHCHLILHMFTPQSLANTYEQGAGPIQYVSCHDKSTHSGWA